MLGSRMTGSCFRVRLKRSVESVSEKVKLTIVFVFDLNMKRLQYDQSICHLIVPTSRQYEILPTNRVNFQNRVSLLRRIQL